MLWPAGIITELGLIPKEASGAFNIVAFFDEHRLQRPGAPKATLNVQPPPERPAAFAALTPETVLGYVAAHPTVSARVGPADSRGQWKAKEIGDGNINYVFVVEGPAGAVIVKQGMPYVRCVGEDWPLSQARSHLHPSHMYTIPPLMFHTL
jgi:5-methylthioribose kinase